MFKDRKHAGEKLARSLTKYKDKNVLVLAIPRGGAEVGYYVAKILNADFSLIIARKLPFPDNPEAGFGAIAEDGSTFIFEDCKKFLPKEKIDEIIQKQTQEIKRRIDTLRKGNPLPEISNRTVILVDDGIAMGSTMRTAVKLCKENNANKIIVAVPVSGKDNARLIGKMVDEIIVLEKPLFFKAVAQVYYNWYDVSDREVIEIMQKWETKHKNL